MKRNLFDDDWKFRDMIQDKIYPPLNEPIHPMREPIDLGPLNRTLNMQDDFRKPMPDLRDPMRDIRPDPMGPMNISRGVDIRPLDDMLSFQKRGVF